MAEASDDAWLQADERGFPLYFQKYSKKQNEYWDFCSGELEKGWLIWNADNGEPERPPGFSFSGWELKRKIIVLLEGLNYGNVSRTRIRLLFQFWEPVLIEGRTLLTTRHQPFAINSIHQGLFRYRIISERYKVYVDEWHNKDELGFLGRVFIHKLPEFSPNIEYYTVKEYPQQQHALRCQITGVNAYPVLDPSRQTCVGVLEVVLSTERRPSGDTYPYYYLKISKEGDLKILDVEGHSCMQIGDKASEAASEEINEVFRKICEAHHLDSAQAWGLCNDCMSNASYTRQVISEFQSLSYTSNWTKFQLICKTLHLRKGQGIVGQALSSHGLIFCSDITQLSIVEYPLAHFAKFYGLQSSFAICLQSSHNGSHVYVLELFLPSSPIINESVINVLRNILGTMKLHFKTFKLASGKDFGEKLSIQFVNGEKHNCYTLEVESQITTSPQSPPGTLQDEGEIVPQDPSSQQSIDIVANAEQSNINGTSSRGNGTSKNLKRPQSKTGIQLGLNDILRHSEKKMADAAKALQVSRSTFKRICRDNNINRWPPRNIEGNGSLPQGDDDGQQILHSSYGMPSISNQVLPTIAPTNSQGTKMPDVNFVNVKAVYRDVVLKFKLSLSSRLAELQHEIAKRLKLTSETYDITYEEEENEEKDLVLIACDDDVQGWIYTCRSQGSKSFKIFVKPK